MVHVRALAGQQAQQRVALMPQPRRAPHAVDIPAPQSTTLSEAVAQRAAHQPNPRAVKTARAAARTHSNPATHSHGLCTVPLFPPLGSLRGLAGRVKLEDGGDSGEVQAARRHVGAEQHARGGLGEAQEGLCALSLRAAAGQQRMGFSHVTLESKRGQDGPCGDGMPADQRFES